MLSSTLVVVRPAGFCAVSDKLPLPPQHTNTETVIPHVEGNGERLGYHRPQTSRGGRAKGRGREEPGEGEGARARARASVRARGCRFGGSTQAAPAPGCTH
eukprot:5530341-Prymnesium_polylepis.1